MRLCLCMCVGICSHAYVCIHVYVHMNEYGVRGGGQVSSSITLTLVFEAGSLPKPDADRLG